MRHKLLPCRSASCILGSECCDIAAGVRLSCHNDGACAAAPTGHCRTHRHAVGCVAHHPCSMRYATPAGCSCTALHLRDFMMQVRTALQFGSAEQVAPVLQKATGDLENSRTQALGCKLFGCISLLAEEPQRSTVRDPPRRCAIRGAGGMRQRCQTVHPDRKPHAPSQPQSAVSEHPKNMHLAC